MRGINVTSEIKPLKKVLLHRPGNELLNITPDTLEELLFDDIPYLKKAQQEHDEFAKILTDNGVEVVYLEKLMAEVLDDNPSLRKIFLKQIYREANISNDQLIKIIDDYLEDKYKDNYSLVLKVMEGLRITELPKKESNKLLGLDNLDDRIMLLPPMPNLYFQRDQFASIGTGASIHRMYFNTRNRETIFAEYIIKYHKDFKGLVSKYFNRFDNDHIEGGDILNLDKNTLAIGISQRTSMEAIEKIAKACFANQKCQIETIYAFDIPVSRAFMHLDTVFTQVDYDKFTVHPAILEPLKVYKIVGDGNMLNILEINDTLENVLKKALKLDHVELIPCGGSDKIAQSREQWNDGSNTLCIAPGVIVVYDRNIVTNELLRKKGLKVIEMPSSELSRGRGGPRCMSMPLIRED